MNQQSRQDFLAAKTADRGGASNAGHHYIQAYNQNKWGFYLKYIRGLEPLHVKPALTFGRAIHDAKEAFYTQGFDPDFMIEVFREVLKANKDTYQDPAQYDTDLTDGPKMLYMWANTYGLHDAEQYNILEVEGSHTFELANGMAVTVRWDLLAEDNDTGKVYLFDTKTTRYSITKTYQSVEGQDQVTMYLLGLSKVYPDLYRRTVGLIPDIMYKRQSKVEASRPAVVFRERRELLEYEQELIGLHLELSQKVAALEAGFPYPHMLFPRNGKDDSYFGSEWPDLYRVRLPADPTKPPPGYTINQDVLENGPLGQYRKTGALDYTDALNTLTAHYGQGDTP